MKIRQQIISETEAVSFEHYSPNNVCLTIVPDNIAENTTTYMDIETIQELHKLLKLYHTDRENLTQRGLEALTRFCKAWFSLYMGNMEKHLIRHEVLAILDKAKNLNFI